MTAYEIKESVVQAGRKLVETGLIARTWGNVSCRIDESRFAITPSGRDYLSLTPDDIVEVQISDCSYSSPIKPSSEKGIHAEVYKLHPEINFVIHTHQDNASIVSTLGLNSIKIAGGSSLLGSEVICASYGLPGTKKLRRGVADALARSNGNAVIMKNHGALCFGKDREEAFKAAMDLENACDDFIVRQYMEVSGQTCFDRTQMRLFALMRLTGAMEMADDCMTGLHYDSERTEKGFMLHIGDGSTEKINLDQIKQSLPEEVKIYNDIYKYHKNISYIIHSHTPNIKAISCAGIRLRPLLDDFAQIVGTSVNTVERDASKITSALKSSSAVFIRNNGALCCGTSKGDATAVAMVMEKACKALIGASLFGKIKPINWFECILMRLVYLKKYSKQANGR